MTRDERNHRSRRDEVFDDYVRRINAGEPFDRLELFQRHPDVAELLADDLETYAALSPHSERDESLGVIGDFKLLRQIGRGGMGVVYEAWENSMDRAVALKVLPAGVAADDRSFQRFMQEARTAGKLGHRTIVPVYSTGIKDGTPWFSMELVEGKTLAEALGEIKDLEREASTPFGKKDCLEYFARISDVCADVADGLQHAHSKGVIHRDVKPSNLIFDDGDRLRILDFGLARLEGQESLTISGDFVGTPLYMSPEQARRKKISVDHRTDVYSLGATMYECLCGRPPFRGRDHADTLSQIVENEPTYPRQLNEHVPKDLETVVLKCLLKDAHERYGTAEALAQDLRRFVRGDPIEARPPSRLDHLRRGLWRRRVGLGFAALACIAGAFYMRAERIERERQASEAHDLALELAVELAVKEFAVEKSIVGQSQGLYQFDIGPLTPVASDDLRQLVRDRAVTRIVDIVERLQALRHVAKRPRDIHYLLGRAHSFLGNSKQAEHEARKALRLDSEFLPARTLLGQDALSKAPDGHWTHLWHVAREPMLKVTSRILQSDWLDSAAALDVLLDRAIDGELYLGASYELRLWRGVARTHLEEFDAAKEDFAALCTTPGAVEPRLLLAKVYMLAFDKNRHARADTHFEKLLREAAEPSRDEIVLRVVYVLQSLDEFAGAIDWAERISNDSVRHRMLAILHVNVGSFSAAAIAARQAVDADPSSRNAHYLLVTALTHSIARAPPSCATWVDYLSAIERARRLDPASEHLEFVRRSAAALFRRNRTRWESHAMNQRHGCAATLASLVTTLSLAALPAQEPFLDDFVADPDPFDGGPVAWHMRMNACCRGEAFPAEDGNGLCVRSFILGRVTGLLTERLYEGDFGIRGRVGPLKRDGAAMAVHFEGTSVTGYLARVRPDGTAFIRRWDQANNGRTQDVSGVQLGEEDLILELQSIGDRVEFRVWSAEGAERPKLPTVAMLDNTYRVGHVGLGGQAEDQVTHWRWARGFVPETAPEFLRGDCNGDATVNIADAVCILSWLFGGGGGEPPTCMAALNANVRDGLNIADAIFLLNHLFGSGPAPSAPYPECGAAADGDDCESGCTS